MSSKIHCQITLERFRFYIFIRRVCVCECSFGRSSCTAWQLYWGNRYKLLFLSSQIRIDFFDCVEIQLKLNFILLYWLARSRDEIGANKLFPSSTSSLNSLDSRITLWRIKGRKISFEWNFQLIILIVFLGTHNSSRDENRRERKKQTLHESRTCSSIHFHLRWEEDEEESSKKRAKRHERKRVLVTHWQILFSTSDHNFFFALILALASQCAVRCLQWLPAPPALHRRHCGHKIVHSLHFSCRRHRGQCGKTSLAISNYYWSIESWIKPAAQRIWRPTKKCQIDDHPLKSSPACG